MPPRTLASASIALSFTLAACVITPVPISPGLTPVRAPTPAAQAPVPTPVLDGERLTIGGTTCIDLVGFEVDAKGRVCPIFPVIGEQCIKIL